MLQPKTDDPPRTLDDFRAWHERQPEVHEFIDGVAKAMAPGSKAHTLIKGNVTRALANALDDGGHPCHVLVDGAIVEVGGSSLIPDVLITCSPLDFSTPRVDEPAVVVEVLSPSTEKDDVIRKLPLYFAVPTIRHVLVIHQDRRMVVHHERRDDLAGRFLANLVPDGSLALEQPGIALAVEAVYAGLPLDRD